MQAPLIPFSMSTLKNLVLLLFTTLALNFREPSRQYTLFSPGQQKLLEQNDSIKTATSYELSADLALVVGSKSGTPYKVGISLINRQTKQVHYQDFSTGDEDFISPYFFRTASPSDPIIILCSSGAGYTYGVTAYAFNKNKIEKLGYMPIALNENPNTASTDPAPYTNISIQNNILSFSFTKPVCTNFQSQGQKNYAVGELKFVFKKGKLRMLNK